MTHICVSRLTITGSDNGLSPGRRQAIIWTNAGILLFGPLGANFSENLIEILTFSFTKVRLKVSSAKWRPFCLGLNVLNLKICSNSSARAQIKINLDCIKSKIYSFKAGASFPYTNATHYVVSHFICHMALARKVVGHLIEHKLLSIEVSREFIFQCKWELASIIACRRLGDKSLSEVKVTDKQWPPRRHQRQMDFKFSKKWYSGICL